MKKKTVLVHPCPKCGSNFLAHGKPYGCTTGLAVVRYDKKWAAFRAFSVEHPWYSVQITGLDEVMGNVYDNPDLAKGGHKHDESRA